MCALVTQDLSLTTFDVTKGKRINIDYFLNPTMQYVLGGSLHKKNTSNLLMGLYRASVNLISIVLMQITPLNELYYGICENSEYIKQENKATKRSLHTESAPAVRAAVKTVLSCQSFSLSTETVRFRAQTTLLSIYPVERTLSIQF